MSSTPDSYATYLFHEGTNYQAHKMFSPVPTTENGVEGWRFAVWAPNAAAVSVVGEFNGWDKDASPMREEEGIWSLFIPGLKQYDAYKYAVTDSERFQTLRHHGLSLEGPQMDDGAQGL